MNQSPPRELAELDSELASTARRDNGQISNNPYQLRPMAQWLTTQSASAGFPSLQPSPTPSTTESNFYNQPASPDRAVQLTGKYGTVLDFTESAVIYPSALPQSVARVLVVATMDVTSGAPISALRNAGLIATAGHDRWEYEPKVAPFVRAVVLVEIYRHTPKSGERVWKLRALGQGWADGLAGLARDHGVAIDD